MSLTTRLLISPKWEAVLGVAETEQLRGHPLLLTVPHSLSIREGDRPQWWLRTSRQQMISIVRSSSSCLGICLLQSASWRLTLSQQKPEILLKVLRVMTGCCCSPPSKPSSWFLNPGLGLLTALHLAVSVCEVFWTTVLQSWAPFLVILYRSCSRCWAAQTQN